MTRPAAELRAEQNRWKARIRECRAARQPIEAAYAAIIVGALAFALGEAPSAAVRIKVE